MGPLLLILLLIVPIAELWVIVQVADQIGVVYTVLLLLFVSIAGAWLLKQQGLATWDRMQAALRRHEMPTTEVTDGALILLGGALLLTPGFL
ncbi:MAG TPA: FxsA family protein, partial [Actinomycetota bacterium]|nr:FxsA family protein [Actinomycetota bacterium]